MCTMAMFEHILVATDFGEPSERALELALALAARFVSKVTLIHVWEFPNYEYLDGAPMPNDYADQVAESARKRMAATMGAISERCPNAKSIVKMGIVWSEILSAIEGTRADLLVVGTHGRRGFKRAILGSVAEKLVRLSPVPVLTAHRVEKSTQGQS